MKELNINELREKIDAIDIEIRQLLKKRMEVVSDISEYKKQNNLPTLDSSREKEILNKISEQYQNDELINYYLSLQEKLMELSKDYQNNKNAKK